MKITMKITGMHCESCESLIKDILADHGVQADISAKDGRLKFDYDGDTALIIKEIKEAGFGVEA